MFTAVIPVRIRTIKKITIFIQEYWSSMENIIVSIQINKF